MKGAVLCIPGGLYIIEYLTQRQLQRLHGIRIVGGRASARIVRQLPRARSRAGLRWRNPRRVQCATGVRDVVDNAGCVPGRRVEHHAHWGVARFRAGRISSPIALGLASFLGAVRTAIAFSRSRACLATGDRAANAPDRFNIVDTVGLLLVDELVQMATQRGRSKGLVAVVTFAIFDGVVGRLGARWGVFVGARLLGCVPRVFLLHGRGRARGLDQGLTRKNFASEGMRSRVLNIYKHDREPRQALGSAPREELIGGE